MQQRSFLLLIPHFRTHLTSVQPQAMQEALAPMPLGANIWSADSTQVPTGALAGRQEGATQIRDNHSRREQVPGSLGLHRHQGSWLFHHLSYTVMTEKPLVSQAFAGCRTQGPQHTHGHGNLSVT